MAFIIFDLTIGKYKTLSLKNCTGLNENPDKSSLPIQASSSNQQTLIDSAPDPTLNTPLKNFKLFNKLPKSPFLKGLILLLSLIFTPLGLALALVLAVFFIALILVTLIVLTVFVLIAVPIKFIISCFHPKETICLDCLAQRDSIKEISKISESTEITSLPSEDEETAKDFNRPPQQKEPSCSAETSTENKNDATTFNYRKK